jgi:hypothetical protein
MEGRLNSERGGVSARWRMNTEEFEKATERDLRQKANECFDKLKDSGSQEWPALLLSARFYMDEVERREHDRVAMRDFLLEVVVILLIGLELYFGIAGGSDQLAALRKLDKSTSQTATAVAALAEEQKAVLAALDRMDKRPAGQAPHAPGDKKAPPKKEKNSDQ